jgi:hypothetical protein
MRIARRVMLKIKLSERRMSSEAGSETRLTSATGSRRLNRWAKQVGGL